MLRWLMGQQFEAPPGFDDLCIEERIAYVGFLWERICEHADLVPMPDWHGEVIEERLREHEATPEAAEPWEAVRAQLRAEASSD